MDALIAFRCVKCDRVTYPKHTRCPNCKTEDFAEVELGDGRVITHTTLTAVRPGFARPLMLAVVDFGNGVRALGQIDSEPRVGMTVRVTRGKLSEKDGAPSFGLRFATS